MRGRGLTLAWAILAVALVLSMATPALAQSGRGTISGVVKDASGSVVPGVTVTATNRGTNAVTTVTTNADGLYSLRNLPIGTYSVNFTLPGIQALHAGRHRARTSGEAITLDHTLAVGGVADAVTVTRGHGMLLNRANAEIGTSMASDIVTNLPAQLRRRAVARELRLRHRAERRGQQLDLAHQRGRGLHQGGRPRRHLGRHPDRRAHRRVQPADGGGRGVHGPDERDPRRVRAHGRRRLQLLPQVGHEPVPGKRLRLPAQRGPERQHLAEQLPDGDRPRERRRVRARARIGSTSAGRAWAGRSSRTRPSSTWPSRSTSRRASCSAASPRPCRPSGCWTATSAQLLNTGAAPLGIDAGGQPHLPGGDPRSAHRPRLPRQRHPRRTASAARRSRSWTSTGRGTCPRPTGSSTTRPSPSTTTPTSSSTRSASS